MLNLRTLCYGNKLTGIRGKGWLVWILDTPVIHGVVVQLIFSTSFRKLIP
jgi:hypothetical protein